MIGLARIKFAGNSKNEVSGKFTKIISILCFFDHKFYKYALPDLSVCRGASACNHGVGHGHGFYDVVADVVGAHNAVDASVVQ